MLVDGKIKAFDILVIRLPERRSSLVPNSVF